jgi:ACR3 family arsenite efflux pump ArsB
MKGKKGALNLIFVLVEVIFAVVLIPVIKNFIASATNLTATESTLLSLITTFIVLALVYGVVAKSGLMHGDK